MHRLYWTLLAVAAMTGAHAAPVVAPYGSWASPLGAQVLSRGRVGISDLRSVDGHLYWTETIPAAGGISGLFSTATSAEGVRISPEGANVRTRVHEYGGASFVAARGQIFYSNFTDQRLYSLGADGKANAITPAGYRYADCVFAPDSAALICVREDHSDARNVRNAIVRIPLPDGGAGEVLFGDSDFVAYPRLSPDGKPLAFISWNHPNMPWDGTLYFISDRSGFWNLYASKGPQIRAVWKRDAEFATPLWNLGQANYVLLGDGQAVAKFSERGADKLAVIDLLLG